MSLDKKSFKKNRKKLKSNEFFRVVLYICCVYVSYIIYTGAHQKVSARPYLKVGGGGGGRLTKLEIVIIG